MNTSYSVRMDQDKRIEKAVRALGFKSKSAFVRYAIDGELETLGFSLRVKGTRQVGVNSGKGCR